MLAEEFLYQLQTLLIENKISTECIISVTKMIQADHEWYVNWETQNTRYGKIVHSIIQVLEDKRMRTGAKCVREIMAILEAAHISVDRRQDTE